MGYAFRWAVFILGLPLFWGEAESGAQVGEPLALQHRFVKGQTWTYHLQAEGQGQTQLQARSGHPSQELQTSFLLQGDLTWTVVDVSEEEVADLALRWGNLVVKGEVEGQALNWKRKPEGKEDQPLRLWVKPNGKVIHPQERRPIPLPDLPPAWRNIGLLLDHLAFTPLPLPDRPVRTGETWEQVHRLELPYLEAAPTPLRFTYRWSGFKTVNGQLCARIRASGEALREGVSVLFSPGAGQSTPTVPLAIERLQQTFTETCYFAPEAGRLERRQWESDYELKATTAIPQEEGAEQELDLSVRWHLSGTLMRRNTSQEGS